MATRSAVLAQLAGWVPAPRPVRCVRVAVDGVDGVGKTTFADELAGVLRAEGRPVVRVSADGFLHDRATRYRRGRTSPEGFWLDSYDHGALVEDVLSPFGPGGTRRYRSAVRDVVGDTRLDLPWQTARPGAVLVVDGLFLHRDGGDPDPAHPANTRYVQGQRLYLQACRPQERADVLVDLVDLARPVVRRAPPGRRGPPAPPHP